MGLISRYDLWSGVLWPEPRTLELRDLQEHWAAHLAAVLLVPRPSHSRLPTQSLGEEATGTI
jgi:hypothetical protein